jgi:hypothetical protein
LAAFIGQKMHSAAYGPRILGYDLMAHFMEHQLGCVGGPDRNDLVELKTKGGLGGPDQQKPDNESPHRHNKTGVVCGLHAVCSPCFAAKIHFGRNEAWLKKFFCR